MEYFEVFPILKTNRLTLKSIEIEDAESIFKMRTNQRVNEFIARNPLEKMEQAIDLVTRTQEAFLEKKAIGWAGILRDSGEIIGTCGFNTIDFLNKRAEIGGELATEFWGKKIALEAVEAILTFGFKTMRLHAIEAKVSPENRSAIFVLSHLGFVQEAYFKDRIWFENQWKDMVVLTLFEENFKPTSKR